MPLTQIHVQLAGFKRWSGELNNINPSRSSIRKSTKLPRCLQRYNFPLSWLGDESKYWDIHSNLPSFLFCLHLPCSLFIYTYHFNDTLDKMRVPSFSHEKILEGTGVLVNLEFLVVSRKRRGNNTVTWCK